MDIALPNAFVKQMTTLLGEEEAHRLVDSLETGPPVSIRLSQHKQGDSPIQLPEGSRSVSWCPWGYYLPSRPIFTADPLFHAGRYYVQEASSMLLYQIKDLIKTDVPLTALDLCAAPGGKSTLLLDLLPEGSVLLSNEVVPQRAHILMENLQKWGNPNSIITSVYPEKLGKLRHQFDLVLVDAPCSGEGMFRKDPAARSEWNESSPSLCAERQRGIIDDIWQTLRDGGILVYSTCTMNREENEDIVSYILDEYEATAIDLGEIGDGVWLSPLVSAPCYRMLPHRAEGEGLFMAVFRKGDADKVVTLPKDKKPKRKTNNKIQSAEVPSEIKSWLKQDDLELRWQRKGDEVIAYPPSLETLLSALEERKIAPLSYGLPVAEIKGKSILPLAPLALSTRLHRGAFECVEIDRSTAIAFLSKESVNLSSELTAGIKLLCYEATPLGFVKHLGNRTNNLYPTHWRIRHREQVERRLAEQG